MTEKQQLAKQKHRERVQANREARARQIEEEHRPLTDQEIWEGLLIDAVAVAQACAKGTVVYRNDREQRIYKHGMDTVVLALKAWSEMPEPNWRQGFRPTRANNPPYGSLEPQEEKIRIDFGFVKQEEPIP
jgi:hypothetical protein